MLHSIPSFRRSYLVFLAISIVISCKNTGTGIPMPDRDIGYQQPVSQALKFGETKKIDWPASYQTVKPTVRKIDLNKIPARILDTLGFLPFSKKPREIKLDLEALPGIPFNFQAIPSKPLHPEVSILQSPKVIRMSRPYLKTGAFSSVYEFGEPLLSNPVGCVMEDKNGFIWIGSRNILYRYDGVNLFQYNIPEQNTIFNILEDEKGQIWVGDGGGTAGDGVYVLNLKNGLVTHLTKKAGLYSNIILRMMKDNTGKFWLACDAENEEGKAPGVDVIDPENFSVKHIGLKEGLTNVNVLTSVQQDRQGNIWVGNLFSGLDILEFSKNKIKHLEKRNGLIDSVCSIKMDRKGNIWVSGFNGAVCMVDIDKGEILGYDQAQGLDDQMTWALSPDESGNIWVGTASRRGATANGVEIIDPVKGAIKTIQSSDGLSSDNIQAILHDRKGQTWIGTRAGLNLIPISNSYIKHLPTKDIISLAEDRNNKIWIATFYWGFDIYDPATGKSKSFNRKNGLLQDTLQDIKETNGKLVILTGKGLEIIDSSQKTLYHYGKEEGLATNAPIFEMSDDKGRIWISENNMDGVEILDPKNSTTQHVSGKYGLRDTAYLAMVQDQHGQVWLTTNKKGIAIIDPDKKIFRYLDGLPELRTQGSRVFFRDDHDNIWLGTAKGLCRINAKQDSLMSFTSLNGLPSDRINSLNQFGGRIYVGTPAGISVITPPDLSTQRKWQVESFGKFHGVSKLLTSYLSDIVTRDGKFLFGDKGITILNYDSAQKMMSTDSSITYVTGIDLFSQPQYFINKPGESATVDTIWSVSKDSFYVNGQLPATIFSGYQHRMKWDTISALYNLPVNLKLPASQNYLQFHYARMVESNPDTIWYQYILEGIDKRWSEPTINPNSENYLNLPPGNYTFKVSSRQVNQAWSKPAEFSFSILPPWWKSIWAYLLYIIAFCALVWGIIQYRSRRLMQENVKLEQKVVERTAELKRSLEELREAQDQLVQREKMASLGELTAGIAHEIQNPLNFVNNFSEVSVELANELKEELEKISIPPEDKKNLQDLADDLSQNQQKINHHGKRADAIVKGMLQHSRSSTGLKEPTDINALADEYLRLSYHGLRAKDKSFNATMVTDFDQNLSAGANGNGKINVVAQDMGRVILNLITNAFYSVTEKKKQHPQGYDPKVSVSTKKLGNKVEIRIKDNGTGIPQRVLDKIFQPFFTTKPAGQGTGLGLSLSYDIIQAHHGELKVETREGEGAEFIIILPQ